MRKIMIVVAALFAGHLAFSQAVKDRAVVPIAVNLNQVMRINVYNGGNIEFTFNRIDQYKNGINSGGAGAADYYNTQFAVASSVRWQLNFGAENPTFVGTDNPANTLALNNVGFALLESGAHAWGTELTSPLFTAAPTNTDIHALVAYPVVLINDNNNNSRANAGDYTDNDFELVWRCGTTEARGNANTGMNTLALIDQNDSPLPDRYVVNVIFELEANP